MQFSPLNVGSPSSFLGGLGSCGGPLGQCGTLGAGPWSEITGLGNVRDPGRFIFTAQPGQYVNGRLQLPNGDVAIYDPNGYLGAVAQGVNKASPVADPRFIAAWYGASAAAATVGYAAYDISLVEKGALFGTRLGGNTPLLNSTDALRIGWSYSRQYGQYVFRIGGTMLGKFLSNPHINLWPPSWWGGPPKP
jgi:hypothetical protein